MVGRKGKKRIGESQGRKRYLYAVLYAIVLGFSVAAGSNIVFGGDVSLSYTENYMKPFGITSLLMFAAVSAASFAGIQVLLRFYGRLRLLFVYPAQGNLQRGISKQEIAQKGSSIRVELQQAVSQPKDGVFGKRRGFLLVLLLLLVSWLPYLLSFAPGSVLDDSLASITPWANGTPLTNHHPVVYSLLVGGFVSLSKILPLSLNAAVLLYSLVQSVCLAGTLAAMFCRLQRAGVRRWVLAAGIGYAMIVPYFPAYAMILWKDPLYSCALLWLSLLLFDAVRKEEVLSDRAWQIKWFLALLGTAFLRNNGAFCLLFMAAALLLSGQRKRFFYTACMTVIVALLFFTVQHTVYPLCHIADTEYTEKIGIPLQQLAATVAYEGKMGEEEREFLLKIMPEQEWKERYAPCLADKIKWTDGANMEYISQNKRSFWKVWGNLLLKNPAIYLRAYGMDTFGFWVPGVQNRYGYVDLYITENNLGLHQTDLIQKLFGSTIRPLLKKRMIWIGSGTLLWMTLGGMLLDILCREGSGSKISGREGSGSKIPGSKISGREGSGSKISGGEGEKGGKGDWIIYLPALGNALTVLLATPVAFSLRYVYVFAIGLPLYVLLPFLREGE
ncbi:MAG: hypothetical protein HXK87_02125 [Lachnospiraceae bacterium]|nr:hypothetical protein [Lachnospiraceae bacterium]